MLTEKQALALARNHQPYGVVLPMSLALSATCLLRAQEAEAEHTPPKGQMRTTYNLRCAAWNDGMWNWETEVRPIRRPLSQCVRATCVDLAH